MLPSQVFDFVVGELEGGARLVDDPRDPGGLTRWGISRRAYPREDIVGMTRERAAEIYDRDYWQAISGDQLPAQTALMVFDCAVNQGSATAIKFLQRAVSVTPDGVLGAKTIAAARARDARETIEQIAMLRAERYLGMNNGTEETFERGWINRLIRVLCRCYRSAA